MATAVPLPQSTEGEPPKWTDIAQTVGLYLGLLLTVGALIAGVLQLSGVQRQLRSAASTAVFNQQLEVNKLFLGAEGRRLLPYFDEGRPLPKDDPNDPKNEANLALRADATTVASSILDFFSHLEDQQEAETFTIDEGWSAYLSKSFRRSPVLCDTLQKDLDLYGGTESMIWRQFAEPNCS